MDSRLLKACQLLMEVAAAQLAEAGEEPNFQSPDEFGWERRSSSEPEPVRTRRPRPNDATEPITVYGDNPNFDPARFTALRRGETAATPMFDPVLDATVRTPFAVPPAYASEENHEIRNVREPAVRQENRDAVRDGPAATLTMRNISDHFERDARRY